MVMYLYTVHHGEQFFFDGGEIGRQLVKAMLAASIRQ